jgi:hypothetical protein
VLIIDRRTGRCFDGAYRQALVNADATAAQGPAGMTGAGA